MNWRKEKSCDKWTVPYLPIDPHDVGREYDGDVIRINSQSGKGGIGFILQNQFGYDLPKKMREDFGYKVKAVSDHKHKELMPVRSTRYSRTSTSTSAHLLTFLRHTMFRSRTALPAPLLQLL